MIDDEEDLELEPVQTAAMVQASIYEEHIEEADFLWAQREEALASELYTFEEFAGLEERLLAHLDGLVVGDDAAWEFLEPLLAGDEPAGVFTAAMAALDAGNAERIEQVKKALPEADGEVLDGFRHALCHTKFPEIEQLIQPLLKAEKGIHRAAAIDALGFRRAGITAAELEVGLYDKDPLVAASAVQAVGRLRAVRFKGEVERFLDSDVAELRREAMQAGFLIGSEKALALCRKVIAEKGEGAGEALILVGRTGQSQDLALILEALKDEQLMRPAIVALGLLGNMAAMDALLDCTARPESARLAGSAIACLTGVDLEGEKLTAKSSGETAAETEDEEDEEEEFIEDPDEDLPVPDPEKLVAWWNKNSSRFNKQTRYRHGQPHNAQVLLEILRTGSMPQRHHAAFELALLDPKYPFLETCALCTRQRKEMAGLPPVEANPRRP